MQDLSEDRGFRVVSDILSYDPEKDVWIRQGQMKLPRMSHGASAVAVTEDILGACRTERSVRDNSVYGADSHYYITEPITALLVGMLITGGYRDPHTQTALRSAEVLIPSRNSSCGLAQMRSARYRHSVSGFLACGGEGGEESRTSCEELQGGDWSETVGLHSQGRSGHTAWGFNGSVLLMGDLTDQASQAQTTEIIEGSSNTSDRFYQLNVKISLSCGIEDVERRLLVLTGGLDQPRQVGIYGWEGYLVGLASLQSGRHSHGCAGYYREVFGEKSLVMVVAGGLNRFNRSLTTTERFEFNEGHDWNYVSPLPAPLAGLRGVTVDNTIFMLGRSYFLKHPDIMDSYGVRRF